MIHAHLTSWIVALILFFVAFSMYKKGSNKGAKISHMILRLFYLLIIATGGMLYSSGAGIPPLYHVKATLGILVIAGMEMVLVRSSKEKSTNIAWALFIISFIVVLYLGFKLPQGSQFF
ncbi:YisL family protein [Cytobacillus sp. IB215665]|uniref:YisL family protein n=1 Tax=Cytobacillus sp. IB215665 TaxID=3097357 RepID=UPI002A1106EF|nr:YisL family protein [Cytobacillus sp. IB215665]MDX8364527.1 YisL family protein [Cytobacillus sp. IB215665]